MCVVNLLAILRKVPLNAALLAKATTFSGLFAGRLLSLGLEGSLGACGPVIGALYFIDGTGFDVSIAAYLNDRLTTHR
jgi:hypothetical protein